jgi:RimJ/RimL family protein N-acetyltransferase
MKTAVSASRSSLVVGRLLLHADQHVARYMAGKMGQIFITPYTAIGILGANGQLVGGMLFNQYTEGDVEVTLYAPSRLGRGVLRAISAYVYFTLGCNRMSARTRASSLAVQGVLRKCGFQQEGRLREYYQDGEDAILFGMLKSECRWLRHDTSPQGHSSPNV